MKDAATEQRRREEKERRIMRKFLEIGGLVAAVVLIGIGIGALAMSINGRNTVKDEISMQQITGTPDMTPAAIKAEAAKAGLKDVVLPTCSVANDAINTGTRARCFAQYMRIHTLEATGGLTYAQLPRYMTADGKGTNDPAAAVTKSGQPLDNPIRNLWVTE